MLDIRLIPLISDKEERRDDPGIPNFVNVPVFDFKVEVLSCGTVSLLGLSTPFMSWLYPFVVPFVSSFRVFDLDNRFRNVPNIPVFFLSRPLSARIPVTGGSADDSLFC